MYRTSTYYPAQVARVFLFSFSMYPCTSRACFHYVHPCSLFSLSYSQQAGSRGATATSNRVEKKKSPTMYPTTNAKNTPGL